MTLALCGGPEPRVVEAPLGGTEGWGWRGGVEQLNYLISSRKNALSRARLWSPVAKLLVVYALKSGASI